MYKDIMQKIHHHVYLMENSILTVEGKHSATSDLGFDIYHMQFCISIVLLELLLDYFSLCGHLYRYLSLNILIPAM